MKIHGTFNTEMLCDLLVISKPLKPMIALHRSDSPEDIFHWPSRRKTRLFPKASAKVPFLQNREPSLNMLCVTYSFRASTIVYGKAKNNMYSVLNSFIKTM